MRLSRAIGLVMIGGVVLGAAAGAQQAGVPGTTQTQDGVYSNSVRYARGQSLQPVFEGWEKNADGTFSMWFGYLNRNYEERLNIPVGRQQRLQRRGHGPGRGVRAAAIAIRVQGRRARQLPEGSRSGLDRHRERRDAEGVRIALAGVGSRSGHHLGESRQPHGG